MLGGWGLALLALEACVSVVDMFIDNKWGLGLAVLRLKIVALIIRIGFGSRVYYNYDKEPPKPYSKY